MVWQHRDVLALSYLAKATVNSGIGDVEWFDDLQDFSIGVVVSLVCLRGDVPIDFFRLDAVDPFALSVALPDLGEV